MKNNSRGYIDAVEVVVVTIIVVLLGLLTVGATLEVRRKYSHETYLNWCKLYSRQDFSYEQWKAARKAGLLDAPDKSQMVIVPIITR